MKFKFKLSHFRGTVQLVAATVKTKDLHSTTHYIIPLAGVKFQATEAAIKVEYLVGFTVWFVYVSLQAGTLGAELPSICIRVDFSGNFSHP